MNLKLACKINLSSGTVSSPHDATTPPRKYTQMLKQDQDLGRKQNKFPPELANPQPNLQSQV